MGIVTHAALPDPHHCRTAIRHEQDGLMRDRRTRSKQQYAHRRCWHVDRPSFIGGGDGVAISIHDTPLQIQERDPIRCPDKLFGLGRPTSDRVHGRLSRGWARVSSPHPYDLARPIPRVSAQRRASGSMTSRWPSKVAVAMVTCPPFRRKRRIDRSTTARSTSAWSPACVDGTSRKPAFCERWMSQYSCCLTVTCPSGLVSDHPARRPERTGLAVSRNCQCWPLRSDSSNGS